MSTAVLGLLYQHLCSATVYRGRLCVRVCKKVRSVRSSGRGAEPGLGLWFGVMATPDTKYRKRKPVWISKQRGKRRIST